MLANKNTYQPFILSHSQKLFWLWVFFLLSKTAYTQNLIFNGGFEENYSTSTAARGYVTSSGVTFITEETGWLTGYDTIMNNDIRCSDSFFWYRHAYHTFEQHYTSFPKTRTDYFNFNAIYRPTCHGYKTHHPILGAPISGDFVGRTTLEFMNRQGNASALIQELHQPLKVNHKYYFQFSYYHLRTTLITDNFRDSLYYLSIDEFGKAYHNAMGLGFYTYRPRFPFSLEDINMGNLSAPNTYGQYLPIGNHTIKLRFTMGLDSFPQQIGGVFTADSAFTYLAFARYWRNEDITFSSIPGKKSLLNSVQFLSIDDLMMFDVTLNILGDSVGCNQDTALLVAEYFSNGRNIWYDANADSLASGDTFVTSHHAGEWVYVRRIFDEIDYVAVDSFFVHIRNPIVDYALSFGDTCVFPIEIQAQPNTYSYVWDGAAGGTSYTQENSGWLSLSVKNEEGCVSDTQLYFHPEMQFEVHLLSDTCVLPAVFEALPSAYQYNWQGTDVGNTYEQTVPDEVHLTVIDERNCEKDTQWWVHPIAIPTVSHLNDPCFLPAQYEVNPDSLSYFWNGQEGSAEFTHYEAGHVHLLTVDAQGCQWDTLLYTTPEVDFLYEIISDSCEILQEIILLPDTYAFLVNGISHTSPLSLELGIRYTIQATDERGCNKTLTFYLPNCSGQDSILPIYFPNAFTPNGDVLNAVFRPISNSTLFYKMYIYNRWGELIHVSMGEDAHWDGTYQNKPVQQGAYLYRVTAEYQNQRFHFDGVVTVLR